MLGLKLSELSGNEPIFKVQRSDVRKELPTEYSFREFITSVKDQGATSMCVPLAIVQVLEWYWRTSGLSKPKVDPYQIFSARTSDDGMSFAQALAFIKSVGYLLNGVPETIKSYYLIPSRILMQEHLLYSPFLVALPVYNSKGLDFWKGGTLEGYHAVTVIGYSERGLSFVNSWGYSYGNGGFWLLPWDDVPLIKEAWGMLL